MNQTKILNSSIPDLNSWYRSSVEWIQISMTSQIEKKPQHAFAVLAVANLIFFFFMNTVAHLLEKRSSSAPKHLDKEERRFNQFLIGLVVGGGMLTFNIALSRFLRHSLDRSVLLALTTVSVAARLIISKLSNK